MVQSTTVGVDIDRVARQLIERHHGALLHPQHILQMHLRAAQFDLQIELHIAQQIQASLLVRGSRAEQILQLKRFHARRQLRRGLIERRKMPIALVRAAIRSLPRSLSAAGAATSSCTGCCGSSAIEFHFQL